MPERSDEALMKAWAEGSMAAFEQLYARHRKPLYRYILRQCGNDAEANDLYQGCWEKIIRARRQYRPAAPFTAWMYRIARNHVIDHFRRSRPAGELQEERLSSNDPEPAERLEGEQRSERLRQAIAGLPDEQKDALLLRMDAGLDVQTIADVSGCNRETAKSRLRYAMRKLRAALEETDGIRP